MGTEKISKAYGNPVIHILNVVLCGYILESHGWQIARARSVCIMSFFLNFHCDCPSLIRFVVLHNNERNKELFL